jgi:hypothetical protein
MILSPVRFSLLRSSLRALTVRDDQPEFLDRLLFVFASNNEQL